MIWAFEKICVLIGSLWPQYIMFELQKYSGVIFHDTEGLCKFWIKTDLWFEKWHEKFGKFFPKPLKVPKLELWWDPFVQSRKGMNLKFTEELCVMAKKNNAKFKEELTCHFKFLFNWYFNLIRGSIVSNFTNGDTFWSLISTKW